MSGEFDTAEFLADYLTEATEHLGTLEATLLAAEQLARVEERPGEALVNALFRAIHTLKGMAGMMGFDALAGLAHEVEQLFDDVRHGARHLMAADYGPIFAALDAFKRLHARIEATGGEAGEDVSAEFAGIAAILRHGSADIDLDPYEKMARLVEEAKAQVAAEARATERETRARSADAGGERAQSVRVETTRLDRLMELVGELVIHHTRMTQLSAGLASVLGEPGSLAAKRDRLSELVGGLDEAMQSVGRVSDELQESTMRVRMVPVRSLFNRFPRIIRDLALECGKAARLEMSGVDTELDKNVIEQIGDPLIHLLRNSVDHGLEPASERAAAGKPAEGLVTLSAAQEGHHIVISVGDDGRGIDRGKVLAKARSLGLVGDDEAPSEQDVLQLIFRPGFSTAARVTSISGRGVGMDVVQQNIQKLGGQVLVESEPGAGARFVVKLPLTLAIAKALLVRAAGQTYAIPLASVEETMRARPESLRTVKDHEVIEVRGRVMPVFRLAGLFGSAPEEAARAHVPVILVGNGKHRMGLVVDALVGQQDVVVKPLGDFLGQVGGIGGATILGDGRVALILDVPTLLDRHASTPERPGAGMRAALAAR